MPINKSNSFTYLKYFTGEDLEIKLLEYNNYKKRLYVNDAVDFLENSPKRCIELYGLRRVGKTVSMFHMIDELIKRGTPSDSIIYVEGNENINTSFLINFLETRNKEHKLKYVFLDEVTEIQDFLTTANNIIEMKIPVKTILTGSSSLVFYYAKRYFLGRGLKINPTYISYKEWNYLKGDNILDYIKNAGILDSSLSIEDYIQDAVSDNIQNSLRKYSDIERSVSDLDLRIMDLINCYNTIIVKATELFTNRFELENIKSNFESFNIKHSSRKYLEKSEFSKTEIYKYIAEKLNANYNTDSLTQNDIRLLLSLLIKGDFYYKLIDKNIIGDFTMDVEKYCSTQPSIRYNQFKKQKDILQSDLNITSDINVENIVEGNILEDFIRINIDRQLIKDKHRSYHLRVDNIYEVDDVVENFVTDKVTLIEIKRKSRHSKSDFNGLISKEIARAVNKNIIRRIYLYRGEAFDCNYNGYIINCINIEEFLCNIEKFIKELE